MPLSRRRASPSRCGLVLTGANAATSCGQDIEADSLPTEGLLSPGTCLDMIFVIEAFPHLVNLQLFVALTWLIMAAITRFAPEKLCASRGDAASN